MAKPKKVPAHRCRELIGRVCLYEQKPVFVHNAFLDGKKAAICVVFHENGKALTRRVSREELAPVKADSNTAREFIAEMINNFLVFSK